MMQRIKFAMVGFGNVGQAFLRLLIEKESRLFQEYGTQFVLTGIATYQHGIAVNQTGINLKQAVELGEKGQQLTVLNDQATVNNSLDFVRNVPAAVILENTPVNHQSGQPAVDIITCALQNNMHVITANKGPVAHAYSNLVGLAEMNKVHFLFESTVMDGAPIFSLFKSALPGIQPLGFSGILNSCTNLILDRMADGESLDEATTYAQSIGIAETDPSADIDGLDASIKVSILSQVLLKYPILPKDVSCQGIRSLTREDILDARAEGAKWKLICRVSRTEKGYAAGVAPEKVMPFSPFYAISGTSSAVLFETDILPGLGIVECNPGPATTAYGLLRDFLDIIQNPIV